jgi:hypothetical protein
MSSLKPLRSVAHNLAHSFASTLNYWKDDYAIWHLWRAAKAASVFRVKINVLASSVEPTRVNTGMVAEILPSIRTMLSDLLHKEGFESTLLVEATLEYDFAVQRASLYPSQPQYNCEVVLKTNTGRRFVAQLTEANN